MNLPPLQMRILHLAVLTSKPAEAKSAKGPKDEGNTAKPWQSYILGYTGVLGEPPLAGQGSEDVSLENLWPVNLVGRSRYDPSGLQYKIVSKI